MKAEYIGAILSIILFAVYDMKKKEIPVFMLMAAGVLSVLYMIVIRDADGGNIAYSLLPGAVLLALSLCTRESIGYGDGLIVLIMGMWLGPLMCTAAVLLGLLLSAVCALFLLILRKVQGKSRIPFVPFLAVGMGVVMFV